MLSGRPMCIGLFLSPPAQRSHVGLGMFFRNLTFAFGEKLLQETWYVLQQIYKAAGWFESLGEIRKAARLSGLRDYPLLKVRVL